MQNARIIDSEVRMGIGVDHTLTPSTIPQIRFLVTLECASCTSTTTVVDQTSCLVRKGSPLAGESEHEWVRELTLPTGATRRIELTLRSNPGLALWIERALRYRRLNCHACGRWMRIDKDDEMRLRRHFDKELPTDKVLAGLMLSAAN